MPAPEQGFKLGPRDIPRFKVSVERDVGLDAVYSVKSNLVVQDSIYLLLVVNNRPQFFKEVEFEPGSTSYTIVHSAGHYFLPGHNEAFARIISGGYQSIDGNFGLHFEVEPKTSGRKIHTHPADALLELNSDDELSETEDEKRVRLEKAAEGHSEKEEEDE